MHSTPAYPKRLIEVDLPIKRISAHARREKSIRHGHISTLHIWWARRPLAACRAVILAALWPDPADPICPPRFLEEARKALEATLGGQTTVNVPRRDYAEPNNVRAGLLDFIAEFAKWDNSTNKDYLGFSRNLVQVAHESLGGAPGTRPLVVDPFAGGGSIPLEALRVGADAFASDLNPIPVLLNKVVLEYIPKYGQRLADEVRRCGAWVKERADKELAEYYPKDSDGAAPIAYLWARTILSEAPDQGDIPVEVPLMRSMWVAKKAGRNRAMRWARGPSGKVETETIRITYADDITRQVRRPILELFEPRNEKEVERGTVAKGSATCPVTGFTTPVSSVRRQLKERRGGSTDARMYCVVLVNPRQQGRIFRLPNRIDAEIIVKTTNALDQRKKGFIGSLTEVPDERFTGTEPRRIPVPLYGMLGFSDLFNQRQLISLLTIQRLIRESRSIAKSLDADLAVATQVCLGLTFNRVLDLANALCGWKLDVQCPTHLFARQAIPMVWDFSESVPISESSGSWFVMTERFSDVLLTIGSDWLVGEAQQASATSHFLPDNSADALITDPPYYFSVPYSDLSDFFYVWLRRIIGDYFPSLFQTELTPKEEECVQNLPHSEVSHLQKSRKFYEEKMRAALSEARRVSKPDSVGTVVFAHSETEAWESLLSALIGAGWRVTASWPIDTEMSTRVLAQRQSTLASSVHLVCRPRVNPDGSLLTDDIGDWRDVLQELPRRIHDWMPRLAEEGVVGADAIFACLGPALEVFSRYSRVEKASGEAVSLKDYLVEVWAAVANEALSLIFKEADSGGLEPDARLTAMWLWTSSTSGTETAGDSTSDEESDEETTDADEERTNGRGAKGEGFSLEFDAARKIAQGLGAHLEDLRTVVEVKGKTARLLPVSERAKHLFGKDEGRAVAASKKPRGRAGFLKGMEDVSSPVSSSASWDEIGPTKPGSTVLDRVHQAMLLFGAGRAEALKRFVVEEGAGTDARFWRLAQSLSALYPTGTNEKRWVDGVLARKKGLGF